MQKDSSSIYLRLYLNLVGVSSCRDHLNDYRLAELSRRAKRITNLAEPYLAGLGRNSQDVFIGMVSGLAVKIPRISKDQLSYFAENSRYIVERMEVKRFLDLSDISDILEE